MGSRLNPYLTFRDNAREAMAFYESVFGGKLTLMTFGEGGMSQDPANSNLIMHAQLETPNGYTLMASDTAPGMDVNSGNTVTLSLSGDTEAELRSFWSGLSAGGTITMPLEKAPWGDTFGMLTDRFGFRWMVDIVPPGH